MDSQERIKGTVLSWNPVKFFGVIFDKDRREHLVLGRDIQADSYGRQMLYRHERVLFNRVSRGDGSFRAVDVEPIDRPAEQYNPDWRKEVVLDCWTGVYGFARRECGNRIFIGRDAIVTEGLESLGLGSKIWCGVRPPADPQKAWEGFDCQILMDESA